VLSISLSSSRYPYLICRGLTKVLHDDLKAMEIGGILFDAMHAQLLAQE